MSTQDDNEFSMHRLLGEIAADTKHILGKLNSQDRRLDKHSDRIMDLERGRSRQIGIVSALSTIIPIALTAVGLLITNT